MSTATLEGRRIVVVGASAGIGQAFAVRAVRQGAQVALVARRAERLTEAAAEAGGGTVLAADLRDPEACRRIGSETARLLGPVDLVFVAAGAASLRWVDHTTVEDWGLAFDTNVIGVNLTIAGLLPTVAPGGIVAACSSESVGHPHPGLVAYSASKAALEESLRGWRVEHPEVRFSTVAVGATIPTEFGAGFDPEILTQALDRWARHGLAKDQMMSNDVADVLVGTFGLALCYPGVGIEHLLVRSPGVADRHQALAEAAENGLAGERGNATRVGTKGVQS